MKLCIILLTVFSLTLAVRADSGEELVRMLTHHPLSDANQDGTLTEDEAGNYFMKTFQKKRPNRGTGIGDKSLIDSYEARTYKSMPYRLLKPLKTETDQRYPLIISLHGSGGIGNDNRSNLRNWNGIMAQEAWREKYPCVLIVPQRKPGGIWGPKPDDDRVKDYYVRNDLLKVFELIEEIKKEFPIDDSRIYALGSSGGGIGTWNCLVARPNLFAAAIPVCGRFDFPPEQVKTLIDIPIWCFHGDADQLIDVKYSREAFAMLSDQDAVIKYTELRGVKHNSWIQAFRYQGDNEEKGYLTRYSNDRCDRSNDIWQWLFRQHKP
jgi:predicted peptidase